MRTYLLLLSACAVACADNVLVRPWGENALRVQIAPSSYQLTDVSLPCATFIYRKHAIYNTLGRELNACACACAGTSDRIRAGWCPVCQHGSWVWHGRVRICIRHCRGKFLCALRCVPSQVARWLPACTYVGGWVRICVRVRTCPRVCTLDCYQKKGFN